MRIGDRFAVRASPTCNIVTTGEVRIVTPDHKAVSVFLRHTRKIERFNSAAGGRTFYTAGYTLYFSPTSDSLPLEL